MSYTYSVSNIVSVATKESDSPDPIDRCPVEVALPDGYYRVWSETLSEGDLCLDMRRFLKGEVFWLSVPGDGIIEWSERVKGPSPRLVECALRLGGSGEESCARCNMEPVVAGGRYCEFCSKV